MSSSDVSAQSVDVAITGMACRFPGASGVEEFWRNLRAGANSISYFTDEEQEASGVSRATLGDARFVKAGGVVEGVELFDAAFFGYSPREAEMIDPQQRLFLECSWEALEDAGCDAARYEGRIGVYAGVGQNTYLLFNILHNHARRGSAAGLEAMLGNEKDHLTTRVSYKLNLRGPSVNVQTTCSTSLVAVHLACQSLLNGECDAALAGGVSLDVSQKLGYFYSDGGYLSPDGRCRAFDADSHGTVPGNGVGVVVLKRLEDALADGDHVYAVIKGSAINNDGSRKVGYTAPSVDGQAEVIAEALALASVEPETVDYVEAHGTATPMGDPIEVAALTQVFAAGTRRKNFCALGSVKTNVGHLNAAAGVAGLMKAALALKHRVLPPSLHFKSPNPKIDFAAGPFYVNAETKEWVSGATPRRAGVSSFGLGGTNAHVVLEEPPAAESAESPAGDGGWQLLTLSARTETALERMTANLAEHLRGDAGLNLADVAHTLQVGRKAFGHRRAVVCRDAADAAAALEARDPRRMLQGFTEESAAPVVFMFPGGGAQYVGMGRGLYEAEPVFREEVDRCAALLAPQLGYDLRDYLYPPEAREEEASSKLRLPSAALPALFVTEYALAALLASWGVRPCALIGHSLGEYVAACVAGALSLEDALSLVALRGRLFEQLREGAMLSVPLSEAELRPLLGEGLGVAAVNAPSLCVVSGPLAEVRRLEESLTRRGVEARLLPISGAGHSEVVEPILETFANYVSKISTREPAVPYVSNVTGTWASAADLADPRYWVRHLRQTVRFADGVAELLRDERRILVEVGPGQTLTSLAKLNAPGGRPRAVYPLMRHRLDGQPDSAHLLSTLGKLWLAGASIDWTSLAGRKRPRRVPLPTYPFERKRFWVEPQPEAEESDTHRGPLRKKQEVAECLYVPSWKRSTRPARAPRAGKGDGSDSSWLVFEDETGLGARLSEFLEEGDRRVVSVVAGDEFRRLDESRYEINPSRVEDYDALLAELSASGRFPRAVAHLWNVTRGDDDSPRVESFRRFGETGFFSLLFLAQAVGRQGRGEAIRIGVVTNNMQAVTGEEELCPEKSVVTGPCRVIPQEYPDLACRSIDVVLPARPGPAEARLVEQLASEIGIEAPESVVAYRGNYRWVQEFEQIRVEAGRARPRRLRERGVYLITGGTGGIGLELAEYLARAARARLVLVGRSAFPARDQWPHWLESRGEEDEVSRKIRKLQACEAAGAEVLTAQADVTIPEQMRAVVDATRERFGEINGVLHCAGVAGGGPIQLRTRDAVAEVFAPRVLGALVLEEVLEDERPDFIIFCSSLNSITGGFGQVDYCSATAFLDAMAHRNTLRGRAFTTSVNWDTWQNVGLAVAYEARLRALTGEGLDEMTAAQGQEAFERILSAELPQVIVSMRDLHAVIEREKSAARVESSEGRQAPEAESAVGTHDPAAVLSPSETEGEIKAIWEELLGVPQVRPHDNFFDLGGHSLLATRLITRIRESFRVELPLRALFESPTPAELAARVEQARVVELEGRTGRILPTPRDRALPLSFAQQRLWLIEMLENGTTAYNVPVAMRLTGGLNVEALERALNEVVRRHEVLRTAFVSDGGEPTQVIAPPRHRPLPVLDLSRLPKAEREARARVHVDEDARDPFDLARGELLRCTLLRLSDEEHILSLMSHHIIWDGWSLGIFFRELSALYEAFAAGRCSPLQEPPVQYADYAVWQRERLRGEVLDSQVAYWRKQLADVPALELPTDYARPRLQSFRGAQHAFTLGEGLSEALKALSRREGATLFMTLLAGWVSLLSRYSGQEDIAVGTPVAGRGRRETEGLIGFFVNTLVLRADLSGNPTFAEIVRRVREGVLAAHAHQEVPFEKLVEELRPERDLSRTPFFQVMFLLQNEPDATLESPALTLSHIPVESGTTKFDLTLYMVEQEGGLAGIIEYNTDLFEEGTVARMTGHFRTLLEGAVADAPRRLDDLPLLPEAERRQLLCDWNSTGGSYPADRCLHELVEGQAERTPDAAAVVYEGERLSYRELNGRANRVAHYLRAAGVGADVPVAVLMERSVEMVVALLGVLKAGGAYVPLDPDSPRERLSFMLKDSGARVLLTQARLAADVPSHAAGVVCVDSDWRLIKRESDENPRRAASPGNLAYVIYTSGSTGRPKGVAIPHRGIVNRLHWMQEAYRLTAEDRVLQKTPYSFDVSVWEFFWPLTTGACLVVARPEGHRDNAYLSELIKRERITTLHFVPPMLKSFLAEPAAAECRDLRRVICSGEVLPPETRDAFFERFDAELHNLYGPTEASVDVTAWDCRGAHAGRPVPIGRPISNTRAYVLDARLRPVPAGVVGELYLGGVGLARGYASRPGLTAERFIPDPFAALPGERLYRTGDLARHLPDGNLEFVGRTDTQVKVRGHRIELGEIEAALAEHPAVRDCVVEVRGGESGEKQVVAYVVARSEGDAPVGEWRSRLEERLPACMMPSAFVLLDALPLTPSGKVDRRALPDHALARASETGFVAPRTPLEAAVAELWAAVLGVERVGAFDNFFALGGHSLTGMILVSRVRTAFGVELPLRALFTSPTVACFVVALVQAMAEQRAAADAFEALEELHQLSDGEVSALLENGR